MNGFANSTIAALCYADESSVDFAALTAELGKALWASPDGEFDIQAHYDDFVVFDLATMRISVAYTDLRDEAITGGEVPTFAECVVVAVGPGPGGVPPGPDFDDRAVLCQGLVDRITAHQPADRLIVRQHTGVFDEEDHDELVEELALPRGRTLHQSPDPMTEELMWELATRAWDRNARGRGSVIDVEEILIEAEELPRATHPAAAADARGAAARRAGTAAEEVEDDTIWENPEAQPLVHRAAVNSLNAAMLVFALPVGAALLTLSVLGRESLGVSSRVTAVTGAAISFSNSEMAQNLLAYFS